MGTCWRALCSKPNGELVTLRGNSPVDSLRQQSSGLEIQILELFTDDDRAVIVTCWGDVTKLYGSTKEQLRLVVDDESDRRLLYHVRMREDVNSGEKEILSQMIGLEVQQVGEIRRYMFGFDSAGAPITDTDPSDFVKVKA